MNFNPSAFVSSLYYMGVGMLSIIIVIGVIIATTMILNRITSDKKGRENKDK